VGPFYALILPQGGSVLRAHYHQRPPPRDRSTKRVELTSLWTVLPEATRQKTLRCLARIVVDHLERREVDDDSR